MNEKAARQLSVISILVLVVLCLSAFNTPVFAAGNNKADGTIAANKLLEKKDDISIYHITYYSDGLKVKGLLYLPPSKKNVKLPVVIFCHDGINGVSEDHEKSSIRIAKWGYAVFCPAYRGEVTSYRDRKKKKEERDRSEGEIEIAKGEVNDLLNSIKMMSKFKWADMNRLGVIGASHGALISVLAATRTDKIKALVPAYGVMNIYKWWDYLKEKKMIGKDKITKRTYGKGPKDRPKSFKIRNAVSYVNKINCPVLILQGSKDKIVPEEQAHFLADALKKNNKKYKIFIYPDALHGFLVYAPYDKKGDKKEKEQTEEAWEEVKKFFEENLSKS